ncbi:MAG TPA: hypothetical protein VNK46_09680 [Nitrospiraceae bacterium]|jgi:hypothetical protein|nr:hypothetical protein [Nitrospiraceae bacterium]
MSGKRSWKLVLAAVFGCFSVWLSGPTGEPGEFAHAADTLNVEGLPKDLKAYRAQIDQMLKKVDALIEKLKTQPNATAIVLDLQQTRDDILRELPKIETAPGDAKWTAQEMRNSVDAKLKLLKEQYEKAVALAG